MRQGQGSSGRTGFAETLGIEPYGSQLLTLTPLSSDNRAPVHYRPGTRSGALANVSDRVTNPRAQGSRNRTRSATGIGDRVRSRVRNHESSLRRRASHGANPDPCLETPGRTEQRPEVTESGTLERRLNRFRNRKIRRVSEFRRCTFSELPRGPSRRAQGAFQRGRQAG